jgi:hypothetical protein
MVQLARQPHPFFTHGQFARQFVIVRVLESDRCLLREQLVRLPFVGIEDPLAGVVDKHEAQHFTLRDQRQGRKRADIAPLHESPLGSAGRAVIVTGRSNQPRIVQGIRAVVGARLFEQPRQEVLLRQIEIGPEFRPDRAKDQR